MAGIIENTKIYGKMLDLVSNKYKKNTKIKKLEEIDESNIASIVKILMENEKPENWLDSVDSYVENPPSPDIEKSLEIEQIGIDYQVPFESAALIYHSFIENDNTDSE